MLKELSQDFQNTIVHLQNIITKIDTYIAKYGEPKVLTDIQDGEIFFSVIHPYSAQKKAPLSQTFIANLLGAEEIPASCNRGDFILNNKYIELKCSFRNQAQNLNIRQIRLWQDVDYYFCFYIDDLNLENSSFYVLTKEQMEREVEWCASATHGTVEANKYNTNIEYSITIPQRNKSGEKAKRWEQYKDDKIKERVLHGIR